jgi:hypothetical protein
MGTSEPFPGKLQPLGQQQNSTYITGRSAFDLKTGLTTDFAARQLRANKRHPYRRLALSGHGFIAFRRPKLYVDVLQSLALSLT